MLATVVPFGRAFRLEIHVAVELFVSRHCIHIKPR